MAISLTATLLAVLLQAASATAPTIEPQPAPEYLLRAATLAPEGYVWVKYVRQLYNEVTRRTDGKVRLDLYTGGSTGDEPEIVEQMRTGDLEGAGMTINGAHRIDPAFSVLSLPFLFDSAQEWLYVAERMLEYFRPRAWRAGYYLTSILIQGGPTQWYSTQPPMPLSDLMEKATCWAWAGGEPTMRAQYDAWGAKHVFETGALEVAEALDKGKISLFRTSGLAMVAFQWFPYVKTVYMVNVLYEPGVIVITRKAWEKLPQEFQKVIQDVTREHMPRLNKRALHDDEVALLGMTKRYVDIVHPKPEEMAWLKEKSMAVWKKLEGKMFPPELLSKVIELRDEYRRLKNP